MHGDFRPRIALTVLSVTALITILAACGTREDNSLGVSFIEDLSELKAIRDTLLSPPDTSADFQILEPAVNTANSGTLLVGERPDLGYFSRALVRFEADALPDTGTSITEAALSVVYREGKREGAPFSMTLHRVTSDWSEVTVDTTDTFPDFAPEVLETVTLDSPAENDTLRLPLTMLVQHWIDQPDSNFGLAMIPVAGQTSLVELASSESSDPPRLTWVLGEENSASTDLVEGDTFLLETTGSFVPLAGPDPEGAPGRFTVGRGFASRSLLRFALPDLADRVTINRAELTLHVDQDASDLTDFTMSVLRVENEVWAGDSTEVGFTFRSEEISAEDDSVTIPVTSLVSELIRDGNYGFLLRAADERPDTDFVRFHAHDSPDTVLSDPRPSLRVWYTPGDQPEGAP